MLAIGKSTGHLQTGFIKINSFNFYDFSEFIIPKNEVVMNNKQKSKKERMAQKRRSKIRTKEEVIRDIRFFARKNLKFLNNKYLRRHGQGNLFYAACKHFGTWNKAILATGLQPLHKRWDKEKVIKEIKKIYEETGRTPNTNELKRNGQVSLTLAAKRHWGCWVNAILAVGLKPLRNDFWSKEDLIKELKKVVQKIGYVPSKRVLKKLGRDDLVSSGTKFFKGYNNFLISSGFEPVLIPNIWSKDNIKQELIKISKKIGRTPTERDMITLGKRTLIMASFRQFKGWNNAIESAGLIPNENCVKDKIWKRWEQLALEICDSLYSNSKKYKRLPNKSMPDFYNPKNKLIIEIKINASDTALHKDIVNYEPYCNRMEVWCLKGKPIKTQSDKVVFRGPEYIRAQIKDNKERLIRLDNMLNEIKNGNNKY